MNDLPSPDQPSSRDSRPARVPPSQHDLLHGATIRVALGQAIPGDDEPAAGAVGGASLPTRTLPVAADASAKADSAPNPAPAASARPNRDDGAPTHIGRYPVRRLLGRGGMGAVWEVWDDDLGRPLAAKLASAPVVRHNDEADAHRAAAEGALAKFLVEAQVTGQLEHPGIVPVHELGMTANGLPYLVMKRIAGRDLSRLLADLRAASPATPAGVPELAGEPSPLVGLLQAFLRVCEAVAFAHSHGVIHRDLKPANIMVGEFGEVLVVDWGLAKVLSSSSAVRANPGTTRVARKVLGPNFLPEGTLDGTVVGTASYMSPEQAEGRTDELGPATDIYALGAILYELLTLETPYPGRTVIEVLDALACGAPVPPRRRTPERDIPWELEAVVLRAMAREPEGRYATARDLRADIEAWLAGKPLAAARYGPVRRLAKWCARHRAVVATAATVTALATVLTVGNAWRERGLAAARLGELARAMDARAQAADAEAPPRPITLTNSAAPGDLGSAADAAPGDLGSAADAAPGDLGSAADAAHPALQRWFAAQAERLAPLDELAALGAGPSGELLGVQLSRARTDARRQAICLDAARVAGALGDVLLARMWIDRATLAGMADEQRHAALERVESDRAARVRRGLDQAYALLAGARSSGARTPQGRAVRSNLSPDEVATRLVRLGYLGPDLVRLLLASEHLDSVHPRERRAAMLAIGMLGDTMTSSPDGKAPVASLVDRFLAHDCVADPETALCLARALVNLRDLRALDAWVEHPQRSTLPDGLSQRISDVFAPLISVASRRPSRNLGRDALLRHQLGDEAGAIELYTRHLADNPDDLQSLLLRADLLRRRGNRASEPLPEGQTWPGPAAEADFEAAQADYDHIVALAPQDVGARAARARLAIDRRRPDAALADLAAGLDVSPHSAWCLTTQARAFALKGQITDALASFTAALLHEPRNTTVLAARSAVLTELGKYDEALADLTLALAISPEDTTNLINRSLVHVRRRDFDAAMLDLEAAIALNDASASAHINRGSIHLERKHTELALADFERALALDPTMVLAWIQRGHARRVLGDATGATADAQKALELGPREYRAHVLRAQLEVDAGRLPAAIAGFTRALELGGPPAVRQERARNLEATGALDLAEQDIETLLTDAPDDAWLLAWRGQLRSKTDRHAAALADYDRALELLPDRAPWVFERGMLHMKLRDYDRATADFSRSIELDPAFPYGYLQRGLMTQARGDWEGSLRDLDRMITLAPEVWNGWAARGRSLGELGRKDAALASLARAHELVPNDALRAHVDELLEHYSR